MMNIKAYIALLKGSVMDVLQFKLSAFVMLLGNIIYLIVIYNLWKAIYASVSTPSVNGMTFNDTMIYLVLASAQFTFMEAFLVWEMGRSIKSGDIVMDLLKPVPYDALKLFGIDGGNLCAFVLTFIPTFVIVEIVTKGAIPIGKNIPFYLIAVLMGSLINFGIDFIVGTICLYSQSIWGINIMKEVVVMFLSGATVPLAFFPEKLYNFAMFLPFHSIYNTPLQILTKGCYMDTNEIVMMLVEQLIWTIVVIVIGKAFFKFSERIITVNGG